MNVEIPECAGFLFEPARFKVMWGGRGGVKSWSIARALLVLARSRKLRIGCARETMKSIDDSVHQLLQDQIAALGMQDFFFPLKKMIRARNGSTFTYHGLRDRSVHNIKSLEAVDILWAEEAQNVTKNSWNTVVPTIRKPGSEIWASFNPVLATDETYQRFVVHPPKGAVVVQTSYRDNPYLSDELKQDMEDLKARDPDEFEHVYEGVCRPAVQGAVYKEQLIAAEKANRITSVPYDASRPVDTFWDLGFGDNVSIWFAQSIGFEFRLIDFVSDSLKDVSFYLKELGKRDYVYGKAFLPHDARAKTLAAGGRSVQQLVEAGGYRVRIVPQLSLVDGMAAVRAIFNRCWFDAEKCAEGIQALKHYRYEKDEQMSDAKHEVFKREPMHDWASHPADAFRYFAVSIREPEREKARVEAQAPPVRVGVWS
ncbi:PBSX family phage terminase large subunit [Acidicapsa dinghuensis]|uniref:PBSX family phage terminase large subunit n=1 Tax=Acidicapsa dinghuensis TaxID=2218256 RepID=A0ABW1EAJ4_9BACT|nr:PBSX family phage terminase large subunit [Acidicapsa dinghuensis]